VVETTVTGLGYELVECERGSSGLLRVYIDRVNGQQYETGDGEFITVDDCEKITRQLQYVLEVEGCEYNRLEVSSPGLDRPLTKSADYQRFAGLQVDVTLKMPFQGRKKYRGVLEAAGEAWQLVLSDEAGKIKQDQALGFTLDEVREARLVPVVDFKRGRRKDGKNADPQGAQEPQGALQEEPRGGQDSGGQEE
jgi:ribosome maturation factor RimP